MAKLHLDENIENVERVLGKNPKLEIHGEMPITMADAVVDSEEADEQANKNLKDKKKFADKPFLGATKQPVPKKPVEPKISLDESLFEDADDGEVRRHADILCDMIESGEVDAKEIAEELAYWCTDEDVAEFMHIHDLLGSDDSFDESLNEELTADEYKDFQNKIQDLLAGYYFKHKSEDDMLDAEHKLKKAAVEAIEKTMFYIDKNRVKDWNFDESLNEDADYGYRPNEGKLLNFISELDIPENEVLTELIQWLPDNTIGKFFAEYKDGFDTDDFDESLNEDWESDTIKLNGNTYQYWAKVFDEGSQFGINKGRISKLQIKRNGKVVCNYDRGWDVKPTDKETKAVFDKILNRYKFNESLNESYGMPSKSEVAKFLEDSTKELLANEDEGGCCRLVLDGDLCLYVGWSGGFDKNNGHDGWEICAKIAERNDSDWSDFEFLYMPWNPETGDVWDTEVSTPDRSDADWFIKSYKEIRKALDNNEVVLESLNESYGTDVVAGILSGSRPMPKRGFKYLSGTDNNGEVEFNGTKYAFRKKDDGSYKVMTSSDAGWNWSETLYKDEEVEKQYRCDKLNEGRKAKDFVDSKGNVYSNKSRSKVNEEDLFTTIMEELAPTHSYSVKKSKFPDIPQSDRYDYEELSVTYEDDNTGIVVNSDDLDFAKQVAEAYGLDTHMSRLGLIIEIPEA